MLCRYLRKMLRHRRRRGEKSSFIRALKVATQVAGIVIGVIVAIVLGVLCCCFCCPSCPWAKSRAAANSGHHQQQPTVVVQGQAQPVDVQNPQYPGNPPPPPGGAPGGGAIGGLVLLSSRNKYNRSSGLSVFPKILSYLISARGFCDTRIEPLSST